jgi:hypothetical protein
MYCFKPGDAVRMVSNDEQVGEVGSVIYNDIHGPFKYVVYLEKDVGIELVVLREDELELAYR